MTVPKTILEWAHFYHGLGWSVVPVRNGEKKVPAVSWTPYQSDRADVAQLHRWFDPGYGGCFTRIGIVLGTISGRLAVRDFDIGARYDDWAEQYSEYSRILPTVRTKRGAHVYLIVPGDSTLTKTLKLADGELRFEKSFVVVPPSLHSDHVFYEWMIPLPEGPIPQVEPVEIGMIGELAPRVCRDKKRSGGLIPEGQRNNTLTSLAGRLRHDGATEEQIRDALQEENRISCTPPLPDDEVAAIAHSISQYPPSSGDKIRLTELGNSRRLVKHHGQDLRFVGLARKWYAWDGRRWCPDETGEIYRRMKATAKSIYDEAAQCRQAELREKIAKWAIKSEAEKIIRAGITLAQSEPGIAVLPSGFDTDPWLLNCRNRTLDLRTGALRPHRRDDLITRLVPVDYDPAAEAPEWEKYLDRVMGGDRGMKSFLQRAAGYSLTGDISEQVLFILYGTGENGKSTFLDVLEALFGDYALHTPTETLMVKKNSGIPNDLARLAGARLVTAVEVEDGHRMSESVVKQWTGGDTITARFLNREFFQFKPHGKIWLAVNHKPQIGGTDHAIWRRIRLVPFAVRISPEERDDHLIDKLKAELPGILRWAVEGCLEWLRQGLAAPPGVVVATNDYRVEMDVLGSFLTECCTSGNGMEVQSGRLYEAYSAWCERSHERAMTMTKFAEKLKERGYDKKKSDGRMIWFGLGLLDDSREG